MKRLLKDILIIGFLFVALWGAFSLIWTSYLWGDVDIEQVFINMKEGLPEVSDKVLAGYLISFLAAIIIAFLAGLFCKKNRYLFAFSFVCLGIITWRLHLVEYALNAHIYTDFYEKEYVAPQNISYTFPLKKRNLIVIYLESMEADYANPALAGQNLLPNLSNYMGHELSFAGFYQLKHQDYTIAAMVSSMCAIPYRRSLFTNAFDYLKFLDGAVCYPQILKQNGYHNYFMKGASIKFASTGLFLQKHGFDYTAGRQEIEQTYNLPLQDHVGAFGGYQDRVLFNIIKQKLNEIAAQDEPFMFGTITLDTHFPDIYLDKLCEGQTVDTKSVVRCSDSIVAEFLDWLKKQPFYENTTVVVLSDHTQTGRNAMYPAHKNRKIINFILNPAVLEPQAKHSAFTTLDIAPTVLNAIGVTFDGGKFGLGRSLFANTPTLSEKEGQHLDSALAKASHVYETFELTDDYISPVYQPYGPFGTVINDTAKIQSYSTYFNTLLDSVYLSEMSFVLPLTEPKDLIMNIRFKTMLNRKNKRHIKVLANRIVVDEWNFSPRDEQPIVKHIHIPKKVLTDNKLAIEFLADDPFVETLSIGIMSFDISDK